jgi:hypothetical protein
MNKIFIFIILIINIFIYFELFQFRPKYYDLK